MREDVEEEEEDIEEEAESYAEKISISLPSYLVKEVRKYAKENRLKRSQVVQKALRQFFEEAEEPDLWEDAVSEKLERIESMQKAILKNIGVEEITRPKGETEKIQKLIEDCIREEGEGFEIEDEEGFKALCQERGLVGDIWTEENLKMIVPYLKIGYDNYSPVTQPEREEFIDDCAEAMKLDEKQKEILSEEFGKLFEEEEEQEGEEDEWLDEEEW